MVCSAQARLLREHNSAWAIVARGSDLRPNNESILITLVPPSRPTPVCQATRFPWRCHTCRLAGCS